MIKIRGARGVVLLGTILTALLLGACSDEAKEEAPVPAAASVSTEVEAGSSGPFMAEIMEPEEPLVAPSEVPEELKTIWEVWALLTREHVDRAELDPKAVTEAAI